MEIVGFLKNLLLICTIVGERAPSPKAFDVFLAPLVRDYLKLWHGVAAIDISMAIGFRNFILRCILLRTLNNFPAYGLVFG